MIPAIWLAVRLFFGQAVAAFLRLPRWLQTVLICIVVGIAIWLAGDYHGHKVVQAKWDRAQREALDAAMRARKDADLSIPALTDQERAEDAAAPARSKPCVVYDSHDRDCGNVRGLR